jgi:hypothetical protein
MKKLAFILFAGIIVLSGCRNTVTETVTYMINEPVFMSADEFRGLVKVAAQPEPISNYGKMCFYDGYIYISESEKGIHIIDNRNPSNPKNIGFIALLGNADLAIRNGKLYADAFIDLVWFDISNPAKPEFEGRAEDIFPASLPAVDNEYGIDHHYRWNYDGKQGVIVGWNLKRRTEDLTYENGNWWRTGFGGRIMFADAFVSANRSTGSFAGSGNSGSVGINGSMSRFSLYKDYLYSVINNQMSIIDLSGDKPVKAAENIYIGGDVETIFNYKDNMFMGMPRGMVIYSVADPLKPVYMSFVSHVFGCDPVVVENDIAYVTVHSGNFCGQNANDLMIIDVSNVKQPRHIATYAMTKPKGLAIDNGTLFVCDDGLKVFNASNPQTVMANRLAHYSGMEGFDVIAFNNVLMMIADDGLYQYDYSDLKGIRQISRLPIVR